MIDGDCFMANRKGYNHKKTSQDATAKSDKNSKISSLRMQHVKVKTSKGRKISSTRWLQRQLNDPYVIAANRAGYRSRSAFKLLEIDKRFNILAPAKHILDLGAAPGGWLQVIKERALLSQTIIGLDLLAIDSIEGVDTIQIDFFDDNIFSTIASLHAKEFDLITCDMALNSTGHARTDHLRAEMVGEAVYDFAIQRLSLQGCLIMKVFAGGINSAMLSQIRSRFKNVNHFKPMSSRKNSAELYLVANNFYNNKHDDAHDG